MTTSEISVKDKVSQFSKQYMNNYHCLEILRFFGGYPNARFSELAVIHALNSDGNKSRIKTAIKHLVEKEVLRISVRNNTSFYSITEDESLRKLALNLAQLDWGQWLLMLRRTLPITAK